MTYEEQARLSRFQVTADLSGDGLVTLVTDRESGRPFVRKIRSVFQPEVYDFLMQHPMLGIPRLYDKVVDGDRLILIEEYISGTSIQDVLDGGMLFSEEETKRIALLLTEILNGLHNNKPPIVHRDIKPSNVICCPDGRVYLIDYNTAKLAQTAQERDTVLLGTPGYAAPEQYGFGASTVKTDIYALGVLMNVMLTGVVPGKQLASGQLRSVIENCTYLDAERRYERVQEVADALNAPDDMGWRRYLLPGMRKTHPLIAVLLGAFYVYWLIYWLFEVETKTSFAADVGARIWCIFGFYSVLCISGDYLGLHRKLGLNKKEGAAKTRSIVRLDLILLGSLLLISILIALCIEAFLP
ncbi:MAG: serine/threonine protein kinase [Lachnospiraceae bacterium]|nr:serine/threonine protein kinase [Lachnospiraceae bacterium]